VETSEAVTIAVAAVAGLVAGRLVTLAIAWLPGYDPPRRLPSRRCPHDAAGPRPADLVPLAGWRRSSGKALASRCPDCGEVVRGTWPLAAEVTTAVVLALLALRLGPHPVLVAYCYLGITGVALAFIDARCRRLPDALTLPAYPAGLVLLGIAAATTAGGLRHYLIALAGMAAAWLLFAIQAVVYPAGVGWGDVKLSGVIGLYLGWLGVGPLVAGLFAGYLLAAVTGIGLLIARRASRRSQVPFGPFLLAGALISILLSGLPSASARGVLGLPAQQVARLALQDLAEGGERGEAHGPGAAVLEYRQVGGRDPHAVRELAHRHLPPGQHHVDVDGDRHQITPSSSACIRAASTSRATAWASSIRSTSTMSATPRMATPIPPMMTVTPGSARWPGALTAVTVNHARAAATIAPITTSTYRKAAWENTVPRRTIVTSRHTQTPVTWTDTSPTIVITRNAVSGSVPSSGSLPLTSTHAIKACTSTVPPSTAASTARSAPTASFPIAHPLIDLQSKSIGFR
jgi:leader peptidase (prepilin peptidase)/N-methyltransferase